MEDLIRLNQIRPPLAKETKTLRELSEEYSTDTLQTRCIQELAEYFIAWRNEEWMDEHQYWATKNIAELTDVEKERYDCFCLSTPHLTREEARIAGMNTGVIPEYLVDRIAMHVG
jgi:hypothetical protein